MIWNETILEHKLSELNEKISKINRKAKKRGMSSLNLMYGTPYIKEIKNKQGMVVRVEILVDATIEGEIPVIKGWKPISVFEVEGGLVFSRAFPNEIIPDQYLDKKEIGCQHCGINRRRNSSILLQNVETLEYKEVGTSCVRDFIGYDPKNWLIYASFEDIASGMRNEDFEGGYNGNVAYHLNTFLAMAKACIDKFGWWSKSKVQELEEKNGVGPCSTSSEVDSQLFYHEKPHFKPRDYELLNLTDQHFEEAEKAIEFFKNKTERNDYVFNCQKIIELGYVSPRLEGIAASIMGVYHIHTMKETLDKATSKKSSEWVGNLKDRLTLDVTLIYVNGFESDYGYTYIYTMKDTEENVFVWFSTVDMKKEINDTFKIVGTVKQHKEYQGKKQTILTRCKIQ